jgi:hypothetical protein
MRLRGHEPDPVDHAQRRGSGPHPSQLISTAGATRAAHHDQHAIATAERGQGVDRHLQTLERLDAAHEQQDGMVTQPEGEAGATAVSGREEGVIDARRDHLHPGRVGTVEIDQPIRFG